MTDFEKQIYDEIAKENGLMGKNIAVKIGASAYKVNSTLHSSKELQKLVWKGEDYKWRLRKPIAEEKENQTTPKTNETAPTVEGITYIPDKVIAQHSESITTSDLLNKQIRHNTLGYGKVVAITDSRITIKFDNRSTDSIFIFPDSFNNLLKFPDKDLQQYVSSLIQKSNNSVPAQEIKTQTKTQKQTSKPTDSAKEAKPAVLDNYQRVNDYTGTTQPSSSILLAEIDNKENKYRVLIVENSAEQKTTEGIYWKNRDLSKLITNAHFKGEKSFRFADKDYEILSVKQCSRYRAFRTEWNKFNDATKTKDLIIYKQKGILEKNKDKYELVDVQLYFPAKMQAIKVTMYYESTSGQFYMNEGTFLPIVKAHGMPNVTIRVKKSDKESGGDMSGFSEESKLKMLGYNVQADGMSSAERHNLLDYLIRSGQVTDAEVASHNERQINLKSNLPNMAGACSRWKEDLEYVYDNFGDLRRKHDFYENNGSSTSTPSQKKSSKAKKSKRQIRLEQERKRLTNRKKQLNEELEKATGLLNAIKRYKLKKELNEVEERLSRL